MNLIGNLTAQTGLSSDLTKELGKVVDRNRSLGEFMKIASGVPIQLIENASLSDLLSCLSNCDLRNFDSTRIARLVRSVSKLNLLDILNHKLSLKSPFPLDSET